MNKEGKKPIKNIAINLNFRINPVRLKMALEDGVYQALTSSSKIATSNEDVNSRRTKPI